MGTRSPEDFGAKFLSSFLFLIVIGIVSAIFFCSSQVSDNLVPEVDLTEGKEIQQNSRAAFADKPGRDSRAPITAYEPFKVIRKKPDFTVADAEDRLAQLRQDKIQKTIRRARMMVDQSNYAEAIDILALLVEQHPDSFMGWMELGVAHLLQDFNLEAARVAFERALELEPNNRNSLEAIKNIYLEMNDKPAGINFLQGLANKYPTATRIKTTLAQLANY